MNFFFRAIASVSAVVLLGGTAAARSAFLPTSSDAVQGRTHVSIAQQRGIPMSSRQTQWLGQAGSNPDLALLSKVLVEFLKNNDYQTQSALHVSAVVGNTTVTSEAQIQTTAQFPNKFRTEIAFAKPGRPIQIKTLVVSDGTRVWVYRADLKQYAVFAYEKFDRLEDSYWIGFATTMFAQTPPEVKTAVADSKLSDVERLQKVGFELSTLTLKGAPRTIDSQNLYAYEYNDQRQGFVLSAFVEPNSALLKQLQIVGKYQDSDITMVERILSRTAIAPTSSKTFTFTPPKGAKKVKALALGPL